MGAKAYSQKILLNIIIYSCSLEILLQYCEPDKSESTKKKQEAFRKTIGEDKKRRERHIKRIEKKLRCDRQNLI